MAQRGHRPGGLPRCPCAHLCSRPGASPARKALAMSLQAGADLGFLSSHILGVSVLAEGTGWSGA